MADLKEEESRLWALASSNTCRIENSFGCDEEMDLKIADLRVEAIVTEMMRRFMNGENGGFVGHDFTLRVLPLSERK
ncbi:hypothetical protein HanIR_Chr06g0270981 [Helianthus annuus]|nr:hypothetical protein HanIR_Chr06g0270981 [Helianthus annuus]